jgi:hypothetical protein
MRAQERLNPRLANHNVLHVKAAGDGENEGKVATDFSLDCGSSCREICAKSAIVIAPWSGVKVL